MTAPPSCPPPRPPVPLSYTRHTSRFLMAWLLVLPFYLCTAVGWDALVFAPLSCFLLFGVDQIGVDLENPFAVLPLVRRRGRGAARVRDDELGCDRRQTEQQELPPSDSADARRTCWLTA